MSKELFFNSQIGNSMTCEDKALLIDLCVPYCQEFSSNTRIVINNCMTHDDQHVVKEDHKKTVIKNKKS